MRWRHWCFTRVPIAGVELPLIVVWLVLAALLFTLYLGFINVRGFYLGLASGLRSVF